MTKRLYFFGLIILFSIIAFSSCGRKYRLKVEDVSSEGNWSCSRGSLARTGAAIGATFDGRLNQLWARGTAGKPAGPLAIHNGALVYPDTKKKIRFYDTRTGRHLGRLRAKGIPQSGVAIADTLAFFGLSPKKNLIRAYNLFTAKRLWQRRVKDVFPGPIILEDRLIVSSAEGDLFALGLDDGELGWSCSVGHRLTASASFGEGRLYQPGDGGLLFCLSAGDGQELFRVELEGPIVSPAVVADQVYIVDVLGNVYAMDPEDGSVVWQTRLDGPIWSSPAVAEGRLIVGHSGGEVVALDAQTGQLLWRYEIGTVVKASVLIVGDFVVAGTMAGELVVLTVEEGNLVDSTSLKGAIEFPPVTDGWRLFVATQAGKIVCFGENNEQVTPPHHGVTPQGQSE